MDNKTPVLITLTPEEFEEFLNKAAEAGAKAGIEKYNNEFIQSLASVPLSIQSKKAYDDGVEDKRLHNTKLLLRNYRALKLNSENSIFSRMQMEESAADILESMMGIYNDQVIVESIKNSATRTAIILTHVETMIGAYQVLCDKSDNEIDSRRYDIIYQLYISDDKLSRKELADKWSIDKSTTYNDEKIAIERLSALIFGIDGLN